MKSDHVETPGERNDIPPNVRNVKGIKVKRVVKEVTLEGK